MSGALAAAEVLAGSLPPTVELFMRSCRWSRHMGYKLVSPEPRRTGQTLVRRAGAGGQSAAHDGGGAAQRAGGAGARGRQAGVHRQPGRRARHRHAHPSGRARAGRPTRCAPSPAGPTSWNPASHPMPPLFLWSRFLFKARNCAPATLHSVVLPGRLHAQLRIMHCLALIQRLTWLHEVHALAFTLRMGRRDLPFWAFCQPGPHAVLTKAKGPAQSRLPGAGAECHYPKSKT